MPRLTLLTALVVALLTTDARAELPAAKPPDTAKLARQGIHVTWPLTRSVSLSPLHYLYVPVRSRRVPVTVSLLRVDRRGRIMRVVKRETLRRGTFESFVLGVPGAWEALRLDVAGRRFWSWIRVSDPETTTISCEHGDEIAPRLALPPATYRAGEQFTVRATNTGRCPASAFRGIRADWAQPAADGGWEPVPIDCSTNTVRTNADAPTSICDGLGYAVIPPEGAHDFKFEVPGGLAAGHYLLELWALSPLNGSTREVTVREK